MRPTYEKEDDRAAQRRLLKAVFQGTGFVAKPAPKHGVVDYAIMNGAEYVCVVEIKCRNNRMRDYPNYRVSYAKIITGRDVAEQLGTIPILFIGWTDCIGAIDMRLEPDDVISAGREDRGDQKDIEPMAVYEFDQIVTRQMEPDDWPQL